MAGQRLYKIGVTQRALEECIVEIAQELRAVAGHVDALMLFMHEHTDMSRFVCSRQI